MTKETQDKLNWLMSQKVDPKRSQIHYSVFETPVNATRFNDLFDLDRYMTIYYDYMAEWITELNESAFEEWGQEIEKMIDFMYEDAKENNMWGFKYDW